MKSYEATPVFTRDHFFNLKIKLLYDVNRGLNATRKKKIIEK